MSVLILTISKRTLTNQKGESKRASLALRLENAHIKLNMFQSRCSFLYNSSAFVLSFCYIVLSHRLDFVLSGSLTPFLFFYDIIASYYTKGK